MMAALHNDDIEIGEILHSAGPELPGLVNDDGVLLQVGQRRCEQLITCTCLSQASSRDMSLATGQCVEDLLDRGCHFDAERHILRVGKGFK